MELPESNMLNYFNKVLIFLSDLTAEGDECTSDSLINHCKSVAFGGTLSEGEDFYDLTIKYCKYCGLLSIKAKNISLSALGHKFLSANKQNYFEITEAQKQLIVERIVFRGAWSNHARELFEHFSVNEKNATYELSTVEISLPKNLTNTIHLFKYLGILKEQELLIHVIKKYSQLVYELTADSKAITEQQLEKILMENRKLGAQAENAVVEFERQRLLKLGKVAQASLVKRISIVNTAAGYDIESFDGNSDDIFPNRFIEVKATTGNEIRFYWTNNEKEVAKKKKNAYWIYMIIEFNEDSLEQAKPIMIQNPEISIPNRSYLTIQAHTFLIKEISVVELSEHYLEELKWYQLV